jgi:hypothetical protein
MWASRRISRIGLPLSATSSRASSSAWSSTVFAIALTRRVRSSGSSVRHSRCAAVAVVTAASTSAGPFAGKLPMTSPVAGFLASITLAERMPAPAPGPLK